jgi:cytochrome P450
MIVRILLSCAFSEDLTNAPIDFWENGKLSKKDVAYSLRVTFHNLLERFLGCPHLLLFPQLCDVYITPWEREQKANAVALRNLIEDIIDKRKKAFEEDPSLIEQYSDLLTILLVDPHFKNNKKRIIDECLTFFFAGSQTSSVAS